MSCFPAPPILFCEYTSVLFDSARHLWASREQAPALGQESWLIHASHAVPWPSLVVGLGMGIQHHPGRQSMWSAEAPWHATGTIPFLQMTCMLTLALLCSSNPGPCTSQASSLASKGALSGKLRQLPEEPEQKEGTSAAECGGHPAIPAPGRRQRQCDHWEFECQPALLTDFEHGCITRPCLHTSESSSTKSPTPLLMLFIETVSLIGLELIK